MSTGVPLTLLAEPDRSDAADAARFRWLLENGGGNLAAVAYGHSRAACESGEVVPAIDTAMKHPSQPVSFVMNGDGSISSREGTLLL